MLYLYEFELDNGDTLGGKRFRTVAMNKERAFRKICTRCSFDADQVKCARLIAANSIFALLLMGLSGILEVQGVR